MTIFARIKRRPKKKKMVASILLFCKLYTCLQYFVRYKKIILFEYSLYYLNYLSQFSSEYFMLYLRTG